ncbi:DUF461 domain-containing protein [Streptomyces sp. DT24]|uniref:DUF461 domain-containing protein n=1 Tax=unclassified Streptomyces TaxID=2593676 RepID=UPI0023BA0920|nr:DUF461 domain-containing protein [Streptomyces sp. AM 4-1-1]WEH34228.1 DUF461 domain-containing protein [Streptomyces sp. AM 4-1-1]
MSRSLRRGALAATAIVFSIASLSACGAGQGAQTLKIRPDNAATSVGDIQIQNANVVTQPELDAEGPAVVVATLFNNGTKKQTLDSVTLDGAGPVKLHPAKGDGPLTVPAGGKLILGGDGNASAVIEKGREAAKDGDVQKVVFKFSETGDIELPALVVPATSYFKGYGPSELPALPSTQPSGSASGSPSATTSGSPSGSATTGGQESGAPGNTEG